MFSADLLWDDPKRLLTDRPTTRLNHSWNRNIDREAKILLILHGLILPEHI